MPVEPWTIKAWPLPTNPKQEFKHVRNLTEDRAMELRERYNSLGYGVVAVVRQRGRQGEPLDFME